MPPSPVKCTNIAYTKCKSLGGVEGPPQWISPPPLVVLLWHPLHILHRNLERPPDHLWKMAAPDYPQRRSRRDSPICWTLHRGRARSTCARVQLLKRRSRPPQMHSLFWEWNPNRRLPSPRPHPSRNKLQLGIRIGMEAGWLGGKVGEGEGQASVLSVAPCSVERAAYISGKHNPDWTLAGADSIKIQRQLC